MRHEKVVKMIKKKEGPKMHNVKAEIKARGSACAAPASDTVKKQREKKIKRSCRGRGG